MSDNLSPDGTIIREHGDVGVPMKPGGTFAGPEDALSPEPKRGNYTGRLGGDAYRPHVGNEPQRPNAERIKRTEAQ